MWGWGKKFLKGSGNSKSDEAPWAHLWSMTRGFRSQTGFGQHFGESLECQDTISVVKYQGTTEGVLNRRCCFHSCVLLHRDL